MVEDCFAELPPTQDINTIMTAIIPDATAQTITIHSITSVPHAVTEVPTDVMADVENIVTDFTEIVTSPAEVIYDVVPIFPSPDLGKLLW